MGKGDWAERGRILEKYKTDIAALDWTTFYQTSDLDILNSIFEENVLSVLDAAAPVKTVQRRKRYRNWVSQEMKAKMKQRDELRNKARDSNRMEDWQSYRNARNECVQGLRVCKQQFHQKLFEQMEQEKTTRGLYSLTKELCGVKSGGTPQQFISEGKIIMKKVNGLLRNIPPSNRNPHRNLDRALENWLHKDTHPVFKFREITLQETVALISSMSESTALGHDLMDSKGIKAAVAPTF